MWFNLAREARRAPEKWAHMAGKMGLDGMLPHLTDSSESLFTTSESVVGSRQGRRRMLEMLVGPVKTTTVRVLTFVSQSESLRGTHSDVVPGPRSTVGVRLHGTIIDEILPWGERAQPCVNTYTYISR